MTPLVEAGGLGEPRPPLRILHVGNIANNAYLNAKILRKAGHHCDVLCFDYYHVMAWPQWEEADFDAERLDHFHPDWEAVGAGDFREPDWFAQGPLASAIEALVAGAGNDLERARRRRERLRRERGRALGAPRRRWSVDRVAKGIGRRLNALPRRLWRPLRGSDPATEAVIATLCDAYSRCFPNRVDRLQRSDLAPLLPSVPLWSRLFACYDAVVGYSTDPLWPLLAGHRPYFAYEHGTLRNIPFEPTTQGRLCALSYRLADVSFVTNCDNRSAAERLGLPDYRFVPHPVNEAPVPRERAEGIRARLEASHGADFVAFHPSRQHWEEGVRHPDWEKGNDRFLRGFARFVREVAPRAVCVCVEWGTTLEASKRLLVELGVADRVVWIPPQPNRRMVSWIQASDVVADQFHLGAFGSTTPKALLHGCPVMLHLDEEQHRWAFPEMPPVVNVREPDEVFAGLRRLYADADHRARLAHEGRRWYDAHHSNRVIAERFTRAFADVRDRKHETPRDAPAAA